MPRVEADFENVGKPFEAGQYLAEIIGAQTKPAKDGSVNIVWEFQIIEAGAAMGKRISFWSYLADNRKLADGVTPDKEAQERAAYYLKKFLTAIKCPYEPKQFDTEDAMHRRAVLKIKVENYQGDDKNTIEEVLPVQD